MLSLNKNQDLMPHLNKRKIIKLYDKKTWMIRILSYAQ